MTRFLRRIEENRRPRKVASAPVFAGVALAAVLQSVVFQGAALATDRIPQPPLRAEHPSPSGKYVFVVSTADEWKSTKATGTLIRKSPDRREVLWSRGLPQQFGPRYTLVNDRGTVLMLDEWINTRSRFAVLLLDRNNREVARHDTAAVRAALSVPPAELTRKARHGVWITTPPILSDDGSTATVDAGGRTLEIGLADGRLRPIR